MLQGPGWVDHQGLAPRFSDGIAVTLKPRTSPVFGLGACAPHEEGFFQRKEPESEASSPEQEQLFLCGDGNSCSLPNVTRQAQYPPQPSSSFSCKSLCRYCDLFGRHRSAGFK